MAKVGRAAHEGARKNILELTADKTLSANDSGKTVLLNSTSALAVTLPDPETSPVGTFFRFVVITANDNAYTISTADSTDTTGDMFIGSLVYANAESSISGDGSDVIGLIIPGADDNKITLDANLDNSGGEIGTWIECVRVSSTQWLLEGLIVTDDDNGTGAAVLSDVD